jgi:hypothetical protein
MWVRSRVEDEAGDDIDQDSGGLPPENENPDDLMDAIITLDDLYKAGEIPEDAYLKRRAELKERLRRLLEGA